MKKIFTLLTAAILIFSSAFAQTVTWNGSVDTDWYNAANWTVSDVPADCDLTTWNPAQGYSLYTSTADGTEKQINWKVAVNAVSNACGMPSGVSHNFSGNNPWARLSEFSTVEGSSTTIGGNDVYVDGYIGLNGTFTIAATVEGEAAWMRGGGDYFNIGSSAAATITVGEGGSLLSKNRYELGKSGQTTLFTVNGGYLEVGSVGFMFYQKNTNCALVINSGLVKGPIRDLAAQNGYAPTGEGQIQINGGEFQLTGITLADLEPIVAAGVFNSTTGNIVVTDMTDYISLTSDLTTNVAPVKEKLEIASKKYYSLTGAEVSSTTVGALIEKVIYVDGSFDINKIINSNR